jgi:peptidoglycan hydrolase-like protein with peptidoglycan-binding domain
MATLFVSYFENADKGIASGLLGNTTVTTSTSSAATTNAMPASAQIVCVISDAAHYVTFGSGTPTAAAGTGFYLPANVQREFRVQQSGAPLKVAGITLA